MRGVEFVIADQVSGFHPFEQANFPVRRFAGIQVFCMQLPQTKTKISINFEMQLIKVYTSFFRKTIQCNKFWKLRDNNQFWIIGNKKNQNLKFKCL